MVPLSEFAGYVARTETRLASGTAPQVAKLRAHYEHLCERFKVDLQRDERDVLVSRAAVLMLIEALLRADEKPG